MARFFSSDFHFFHRRIIEYSSRPFKDIEEMNAEIIRRYNSVVKTEDITYILGDISFRENEIKNILSQLNGIKHLILGNHDSAHSSHKKYEKSIQKFLYYGFSSVQERMELQIANRTVMLSHLPFLKEGDIDQRYSQFRPIDRGQFLLCGHVHEKWKISGRMINVGVDQWDFTPVSETQISELIADIIEGEQV